MEGLKKEVLLSFFPKITFKRYQKLLAFFNSLENIWTATKKDFIEAGWEEKIIDEFFEWKNNLDEEKIKNILDENKIKTIAFSDDDYPEFLKNIYDPPICLFIKGKLIPNSVHLAVVGPRKNSFYGRQITEKIVSELCQKGIIIVSGLAFGIDSIAHSTCVKNKKPTVAVLGGGIDDKTVYPRAHLDLAKKIIENNGAIISEYPPFTEPTNFSFPKRNRIVVGLSQGVLVIEAKKKSGALITADLALQNGREVFAIPQNINSENSKGVNDLLKNGANLLTESDDIFKILNLQNTANCDKNKTIIPESKNEEILLKFLSYEAAHIDFLIKNSGLESQTVNSTLSLMEIKGWIKNLGNMMYILNN